MSKTTLEQRFGVASAIGISGALVALAIGQSDGFFSGDLGFCRCAAAGAFVAGFALASGFGREGVGGLALAAASFLAATVMGACIAVLFMPLEELIARIDLPQIALSMMGTAALGPLYVIEMITSKGAVLLPWMGSILAIQLLALYLRDRRG